MDRKAADKLRAAYPNYVPLQIASELLGVSPRQLSRLVAEGREPYSLIGGNIGTRQRYVEPSAASIRRLYRTKPSYSLVPFPHQTPGTV